ncbi:hypothetical protein DPX16_23328 [Anabarilius grahami]|uniref:Uncharacterized protein n=1 Tax=Anabarilius grahami TaxID=495550 RepID=A0A3N0YIP1_ANAGA|nr:hypothetical protein DPX16_23328 [Anabarilius grahami]
MAIKAVILVLIFTPGYKDGRQTWNRGYQETLTEDTENARDLGRQWRQVLLINTQERECDVIGEVKSLACL